MASATGQPKGLYVEQIISLSLEDPVERGPELKFLQPWSKGRNFHPCA